MSPTLTRSATQNSGAAEAVPNRALRCFRPPLMDLDGRWDYSQAEITARANTITLVLEEILSDTHADRARTSRNVRKNQPMDAAVDRVAATAAASPIGSNIRDHQNRARNMKITKQMKQRLVLASAPGLAAAAIFLGLAPVLDAQQAKTNPPASKTNDVLVAAQPSAGAAKQPLPLPAERASTNSPAKKPQPVIRQLSGAELYSMNCARCHPERYPNERNSAQWKTIALHMRVRANLPAEQVRKVLKYLQENSGY